MKSLILVGLILMACGSNDDAAQPEETGGTPSQQQQLTSTGGKSSAPLAATGGSSAALSETGGQATQATGGRSPTGGSAAATGGLAGTGGGTCKPLTCSGAGASLPVVATTFDLSPGCGMPDVQCMCTVIAAPKGSYLFCSQV